MHSLSPFRTLFAGAAALAALGLAAGSIDAGRSPGSLHPAQSPVNWVQSVVTAALDTMDALKPEPPAPPVSHYDPHDGRSRVVNWRASLEAFAESDRINPPAPGGIVFVGSSSIAGWNDLEKEFPGSHIVKRGFGGSLMADCARYVDRLVLPYKPKTVIVYAGDNDLASNASPQEVLERYVGLVEQVHAALPESRIAFISIKPSPLRVALMPLVRQTNELVAAYTRSDPRLDYIDIYSRMLDPAGRPRADLFQADGLHPNAAGYAVWKAAIADQLR